MGMMGFTISTHEGLLSFWPRIGVALWWEAEVSHCNKRFRRREACFSWSDCSLRFFSMYAPFRPMHSVQSHGLRTVMWSPFFELLLCITWRALGHAAATFSVSYFCCRLGRNYLDVNFSNFCCCLETAMVGQT